MEGTSKKPIYLTKIMPFLGTFMIGVTLFAVYLLLNSA